MNDIVLDGAKVAGVLCFTQMQGQQLAGLVVGIGINVEVRPVVEPTPFVPQVEALRSYSAGATLAGTLANVCLALDEAISCLLDGRVDELLSRYRLRSVAVGKQVEVWPDGDANAASQVIVGTVEEIGSSLDLVLSPGDRRVHTGRLRLLKGSR